MRNRFVLTLALFSFAFLMGCGGNSPRVAVPPPSGTFSNGSLSGTYLFSSGGVDANGFFLAVTGSLQANGSGGITGGMIDVNSAAGVSSTPISSGTYAITADGRGTATLAANTPLSSSITLNFVLTSSSHGLVTEFDSFATGSGTIDLQSSGALQSSYAFGLSGISVSGNTEVSFSMAGAFTVDGTGTITSGIADINNNGNSTGTMAFALTGTVAAGTPGTASLTTPSGTFNFHVYMVNPTHLKFIETDAVPAIMGDAFTQQASVPAGVLTYTMQGADVAGNPLGMGGFVTSDGTSVISGGLEDYNDAGNVASVSGFNGSYTALSGGRAVVTLNSFYNGANGIVSPTVTFAAYPTTGGIQLLEIDSAGLTGGVAFAQTATSFAASQGYGLNLTAFNGRGFEEDDIAEFSVTGSTFRGLLDVNDQGSRTRADSFSGTFTTDTAIAGHGSASSNRFNYNYYVVSGSTILALETDNNQVGVGGFELQTPPQQGAGVGVAEAHAHFMVVRPKAGARTSRKSLNN